MPHRILNPGLAKEVHAELVRRGFSPSEKRVKEEPPGTNKYVVEVSCSGPCSQAEMDVIVRGLQEPV